MRDAIVIGADLTGLTVAPCLAHGGAKITPVMKGIGSLQFSQGTADLFGCFGSGRTTQPPAEVGTHIASRPGHPYSHLASEFIAESVNWLKEVLDLKLLVGDSRQNAITPTSLGVLRPTSLYQLSMAAGILAADRSYMTVELKRLRDFCLKVIAENLSRQATVDGAPIQVRSLITDVEIQEDEVSTTGVNRACTPDNAAVRERFVVAITPHLREGEVIGLPAVLSLNDLDAWKDIEKHLGHEAFEIVIQPLSIPGMHLNQELTALVKIQACFITSSHVAGIGTKDGVVITVSISTAGCPTRIETKNVVLAGGGFESGALDMDFYEAVTDPTPGLPILGAEGQFFHGDFWSYEQPVFPAGLSVDSAMHPLDVNKKPVYPNVYVTGGNPAGATHWRGESGEGIAPASALCAADQTLGGLR